VKEKRDDERERALRGRHPEEVRAIERAEREVDEPCDGGSEIRDGERERHRLPRLPHPHVGSMHRDEERRGHAEGDRVRDRVGDAPERARRRGAASGEDAVEAVKADGAHDEEHRPELVAGEHVEDRAHAEGRVRQGREVGEDPPAVGHGVSRVIELVPARTRSPTLTTGLTRAAGRSTSTRDPRTIIPRRSPFRRTAPTGTNETNRRATTPVTWMTSTGPRALV